MKHKEGLLKLETSACVLLNKDEFLNKYQLGDLFEHSGLTWENLAEIYECYTKLIRSESFQNTIRDFEMYCREKMEASSSVHSVRCRVKDPEHVIEKIIRKRGKEQSIKYRDVNCHNYKEIIRDLVGLRVLVLKKEDWRGVFDCVSELFPNDKSNERYMAEDPITYVRYGDRDIYDNLIRPEYTNKGYRSQHYVVRFDGIYCEIQARTLAEEVYGEFDHMVKYPYRMDNKFLKRYTNTVSKLTDSIDEMLSTCFQMQSKGWEECSQWFDEDCYCDWKQTNQSTSPHALENKGHNFDAVYNSKGKLGILDYANLVVLRKGN